MHQSKLNLKTAAEVKGHFCGCDGTVTLDVKITDIISNHIIQ